MTEEIRDSSDEHEWERDERSIIDTLTDAIKEHKGIVTNFVVICKWVDDDGNRRIWMQAANGQMCDESMGLLNYALELEKARAQDHFRGGDEEDAS